MGIKYEWVMTGTGPMLLDTPTTTIIQGTGGAVAGGSAVVTGSVIVQRSVAEVSPLSEADQLRLWAERRDAVATPEQDGRVLRGGWGG